ncbi:hypothetical protein JK358_36695 [Nocardia sp. 2]|uniref:Uncharacterized protein n=1 Tax=Nocardia acididurans TaxID=2802282 RepID=A0ABS1MIR6_9NOCA|nr:hypothetical protein [Nocardia acididurans]
MTVRSLESQCTDQQILDLFAAAPTGTAPRGTKTITLLPLFQTGGSLLPYDTARAFTQMQSTLGSGLTFTTGPQGPWVYKDYFWGQDAGGPLQLGSSSIDGKPAWVIDYSRDFAGIPLSVHNIRQLTPGVWIGRDTGSLGPSPTDPTKPTGGAFALN